MRKLLAVALFLGACSSDHVTAPQEDAKPKVEKEVEEIFSAPDSASTTRAFTKHLQTIEALYASNPTEALTISKAAYQKAFESITPEDEERADEALSGMIFGPGGLLALRAQTAISANVTILVVNGIHNSRDAAAIARKEVELIVKEIELLGKANVYGVYNGSFWHDKNAKRRCMRRALGPNSVSALEACGMVVAGDILESMKEISSIMNELPPGTKEAKSLVARIKLERELGKRVIILGHSQGTLIASEAMKLYGKRDLCVSAISLAGPLGQSSWSPQIISGNLSGFVLAGVKTRDLILALGYNDFPKLATNLTQAADERVGSLSGSGFRAFAEKVFEDFNLHLLLDSYLTGVESRAAFKNLLRSEIEKLSASTCVINPGEE